MKTAHRDSLQRLLLFLFLLTLLPACNTAYNTKTDYILVPCGKNASISFEGETQAGHDIHRLEVRRLAYCPSSVDRAQPTTTGCVIYWAGQEYGPTILRVLDDCIDPIVKQASSDMVDVYFLSGAHTHIHERWKLSGASATLLEEKEIDWKEDPRLAH